MSRLQYIVCFLFALLFAGKGFAQLSVFPNGNANQLVQTIVGNNIQITNSQLNCASGGAATFTASSTNLGLTAGILLTTGSAANAVGPNNDQGSADPNACINAGPTFNDANLSTVEPNANYDGCVLEFDIVPVCNTLNINYIFASEEYPEYVNASYNDAFGFFISGPNPGGGSYTGLNIAKLPNGTPVSIDNVNAGLNSGFYVNNTNGSTIQYDGFTTPLVAAVNVTPCASYHLRLVIADAGDCIYDSGVFLAYKGLTCPTSQIPVSTASTTPVLCGGDGSATVSVTNYTGTPTYQWSPGGATSATISNLNPGTYTCVVSFQNPCPFTQTVTATVTGQNAINASITTTPSTCNSPDGTATASISGSTGPYVYSWSTTPVQTTATASGLIPGTYTVTVSDNAGCTTTYQATVLNNQPTQTVADSLLNTTCGQSNGAVYINSVSGGSSPFSYSWSSGQLTDDITNIAAGNYTLTITDNLNCSWTYDFVVPDITNLPSTSSFTPERCEQTNGTATINVLNGVAPFTYVWSTTPVQSTATATGLDAGNYTVTVTDAAGCNASASFAIPNINDVFNGQVILNPQEPEANVPFTVTLSLPSIWTLDQSNWIDGTTSFLNTNSFMYPEYGTYNGSFWVTSVNGCHDTIEYSVFVKDYMTLYVPNAFTPNRDNKNDTFNAYGTLVKSFRMEIYDRWGELIFESESLDKGWDGFYKGDKVQNDVYVWKVYARDYFNNPHFMVGHVTVVR